MQTRTHHVAFSSVEAELEAIDAKAAVWLIQCNSNLSARVRLITLHHQAMKFVADARAMLAARMI